MGMKVKGAHCVHCKKNVMAQANKPNHVLHLILTVITAGLWAIVWLLLAAGSSGNYRCTECGQKVS